MGSGWNWCLYTSSSVSCQPPLISMVSAAQVACAAAIIHRNHFFCLYQQNKSGSKAKFRQTSDYCKRVLEAAKLTYPSKTKVSIISQKLCSRDFWWIANIVLNKINLLYLLYSTVQGCCLLHLIKQNCFLKTSLRTLILMIQVSIYLFSLLELIWNCIIFLSLKSAEPCKCVILLVSRILWHKRISPSLKEWRFWYLILTGDFLP